jgi:uncharacterized membrane protein YjfL (UPF0719 family)
MTTDSTLVGVLAAIVQFVIGLILAMGSVYIGLKMFDKITKDIDEWEEVKKGNVAVGILMAAVIIAIANVVQSGVLSITASFNGDNTLGVALVALSVGILNLLIALVAAIVAIYMAIRVLDRITTDIDEMAEIKKGNIPVAIIMAGVLFAVSFVISSAVAGFSNALDPQAIADALNIH